MEIRAQLEDITSVKKKLVIEIPVETAAGEFEKVAQEYKRYARLPGFRPGKAPLQLVKRRYAGDIRGEVIKKLVPEAYEEAVRQEGIKPLSQPDLENLEAEEGKAFSFEAHFEILPEIELPSYKGLEVEVESEALEEEDVNKQLEALREQNAQLVAVEDRPIADGDQAMIDLKGESLDLEEDGPSETVVDESIIVHVGDEGTHPSFNENLIGLNIGEEKTFEVDYAEDYPEEKLAGRKVRFTAEVTDVKRKELPELNDEFAKDVGDFESIEEIENRIRADLESARETKREADIRKALTNKLIGQTSFDVPEVLVKSRLRERLETLAGRMANQGIDPARANLDWKKVRDDMQQDVVDEVRGRLIVDAVAAEEGVDVSAEEITQEIKQIAASMNVPEQRVRQHFMESDEGGSLKADIRRRKALAIIVNSAKVK
jgi:trigger factor